MRKSKKRVLGVLGIGVIVLAAAGGAFAYWTQSGSGEARGTAGTTGAIVVTGTIADGIFPGGNRLVSFMASNSGDSATLVNSVRLAGVSTSNAECVVADFTMPDVSQNQSVAGGAGVGTTAAAVLPNRGTLSMANTGVSQDACKSAVITLTLSTT